MTTGLAVAALILAVGVALVLGVALVRTRARLARVERLVGRLDGELHHEVRAALEQTRDEARAAGREARIAARAAGVPEEPPRLPFEPVTAKLVRVAAFGAGVGRAARRLTSAQRGASRRTTPDTRAGRTGPGRVPTGRSQPNRSRVGS